MSSSLLSPEIAIFVIPSVASLLYAVMDNRSESALYMSAILACTVVLFAMTSVVVYTEVTTPGSGLITVRLLTCIAGITAIELLCASKLMHLLPSDKCLVSVC